MFVWRVFKLLMCVRSVSQSPRHSPRVALIALSLSDSLVFFLSRARALSLSRSGVCSTYLELPNMRAISLMALFIDSPSVMSICWEWAKYAQNFCQPSLKHSSRPAALGIFSTASSIKASRVPSIPERERAHMRDRKLARRGDQNIGLLKKESAQMHSRISRNNMR